MTAKIIPFSIKTKEKKIIPVFFLRCKLYCGEKIVENTFRDTSWEKMETMLRYYLHDKLPTIPPNQKYYAYWGTSPSVLKKGLNTGEVLEFSFPFKTKNWASLGTFIENLRITFHHIKDVEKKSWYLRCRQKSDK